MHFMITSHFLEPQIQCLKCEGVWYQSLGFNPEQAY